MEEMIVASKLSKRFRRLRAVDQLDLTVSQGEVFGFLGPNGAGKSTTLRMMVGLVRPTSGSVRLFGKEVWRNRRSALRRVGAMIEAPAFYKYLNGFDNLRILSNTGADYAKRDLEEALDKVGLLDRAYDKVKGYSQGMRQRLAIALSIVGKPDLILLDEPTNGLDPQGMKEVRDLIRRLSTDLNLTVFLSSHLLNEVEQVCTRIAVIDKGRIVKTGTISELLEMTNRCIVDIDSPERASQAISDLAGARVVSVDSNSITVSLDGESSAELNRFFVERGFAVSALKPQKTSLEELYLSLMAEND